MSKLCFFVAASRFVCLTQCIKQPPKSMTIIAVQCMRKLNSHTEGGGFNSIIAIILLLAWLFFISLIEIFLLVQFMLYKAQYYIKCRKFSMRYKLRVCSYCINPFQHTIAFHIETSHLFCGAKQVYMKFNTASPKWFNFFWFCFFCFCIIFVMCS